MKFTADDLPLTAPLPNDMRDEIEEALETGRETKVFYRRTESGAHMAFFPAANRGGVCHGGQSEWTDCFGLDDLADRWEKYDERWCN